MKCPECEASLREGAKFCDQCGAKITEPEKALDLSPVALKLLGGIGTGLKYLGETVQEWVKSAKGEEEKKEKDA